MMKMKLFAQATWVKLTTKNFEKLDDFNLIYNKKLLPIPYVSSTPYHLSCSLFCSKPSS